MLKGCLLNLVMAAQLPSVMKSRGLFLALFFCSLLSQVLLVYSSDQQYQPNWQSLDSRPLPAWYDESKFGIFMHWGLYSVPSFGSEWFWRYWTNDVAAYVNFMKQNYPPGFTYADFAKSFRAELFDADKFAEIVEASGARYFVLTSKHHEGYAMWPSKYSWNWNSMDVGPKRDLIGEMATAIRKRTTQIHFGLYHSLFAWYHPLYLQDVANKFSTRLYPEQISTPMLHELVNNYEPDLIWSDGFQVITGWEYWNSTGFLAWLYNDSPIKDKVVVNDRWGNGTVCKHGGFFTCHDRYNPGTLQKHKWENAMTVDKGSWGYRRNVHLSDFLSTQQLLHSMAKTISCGGNMLLNVGPTHDGRIIPIFEERLRQVGSWLKVNGEAIYKSKPWRAQNDTNTTDIWYTSQLNGSLVESVYAIVLEWPVDNRLFLGAPIPNKLSTVSMLGVKTQLQWKVGPKGVGMNITFPVLNPTQMPCQWAWVLKLQKVK
ncbi:alpha-L-fucosidase-like [Asterias rubens]|uniref:alpha-L-fucosidase-like n=1 Tax=Asterias rubens TaxID=7604 RepID=UPI0014556DF9|nr:alpha-L-fucosidase-like [Asterias rubens]